MRYCLISDRKLYLQSLPEVAAHAEAAGVDYFQLREKDLPVGDLLVLAKSIRPVLNRTKFIVNGTLEVALASRANGVHLQRENVPVHAVRSAYPELIVGYSAHSLDDMKAAAEAGASYVFISPVFKPLSKTSEGIALGPAVVCAWSRSINIPAYALGGISADNLTELQAAGCANIAGISFFVKNGMFTSNGMAA